jgi:hypothetical protein
MRRAKWNQVAFLTCATFGFAQPPAAPAAPQNKPIPNEIKMVVADVTVIEESTLIPFAGNDPDKGTKEIAATDLPGGSKVKHYSAASGDTIRDAYEEAVTSMRCYGFLLSPGETIAVRLKVNTSSRLVMRIVPPRVADGMASQILMANLPPRAVRSSRIQIKNITKEPYQVNLALSGLPNYPFKMEIQRKKG